MSFKSVILICLNIILCNVLICSRSPLFTFQIASRCWIYPGPVLVVANEYTLCFPLFQAYAGLEQKFLNDQFSIFLFVNYCKIKITSSILEKLPPVNIHVDNLFFHFFSGLRRLARSSGLLSSGLVGAWRFSKEYKGHVHDNMPGFDILHSICAGELIKWQYDKN